MYYFSMRKITATLSSRIRDDATVAFESSDAAERRALALLAERFPTAMDDCVRHMCGPADAFAAWFVGEIVEKRARVAEDYASAAQCPAWLVYHIVADLVRAGRPPHPPASDALPVALTYADVAYAYIFEICTHLQQTELASKRIRLARSRIVNVVAVPPLADVVPGWALAVEFARRAFADHVAANVLADAGADKRPLPPCRAKNKGIVGTDAWRKFVADSQQGAVAPRPNASLQEAFLDIDASIRSAVIVPAESLHKSPRTPNEMSVLMHPQSDVHREAVRLQRLLIRLVLSLVPFMGAPSKHACRNTAKHGDSTPLQVGYFCGHEILGLVVARCRALADV